MHSRSGYDLQAAGPGAAQPGELRTRVPRRRSAFDVQRSMFACGPCSRPGSGGVPADPVARRAFLRTAALGTAAAAAGPLILRSAEPDAGPANARVNLAIIGCGNQAPNDLPEFLHQKDVQVVAVCDVNRGSTGYRTETQRLGREPVRDLVNAYYAKNAPGGTYRGCDAVADFREILARPDVDAVAIIAPDHWHAIMAIRAAAAGKDIYCQKPLGLTVRDGQEMIRAVRSRKRILQTGSQWRSNPVMRRVCEAVRNGRIGTVRRVFSYVAENNFAGPGPGWQPMPVPEGFDYDFWLGPAPQAPYHKDRCFYRFRFISEYSGGQTTNFGAHANDLAQWGLGADDTGPVEVGNLGAEWPPAGDLFDTATRVNYRCRFASGAELVCVTRKAGFGIRFEGDAGWLETAGKTVTSEPAALKEWTPGPGDVRLYESANHYRNFIECVRSRREPISPVEVGHRTAILCHLGNIAMKLNRKLRWDPQAERFEGDDEANGMLSRPHRAPWGYA